MDDFLPETSSHDPSTLLCLMFEEDEEEEDERRKRKWRDNILSSQIELALLLMETKSLQPRPKREKTRSCKKNWSLQQAIDKDRKVFALAPKTLFWYEYSVLNGENLKKSLHKFRNQFQLLYKN